MPTLAEQLASVEAQMEAYRNGTDVPYYQAGEEILRGVPYSQLAEHQTSLKQQIAGAGGNGSSFHLAVFDSEL